MWEVSAGITLIKLVSNVMVYRCGKCRRFLKYISAKPQRMYCANCDETYSLPQGGTIKLYKVHGEGNKLLFFCVCVTSPKLV